MGDVVEQKMTREEALDAIMKAMLVGPARALNLIDRMGRRFAARGWPADDRMHIATAAVSLISVSDSDPRLSAMAKKSFRIAPGSDDPECWKALVGISTAEQIVFVLELHDMLSPEKVTGFIPLT